MMRIAVMGSGGVGGLFGAKLAHGGADVAFIARGRHLAALREHGLRVEGPSPLHLPQISASDDPAAIGPVDLVLFAVKLWDTQQAIEQIRPLVGDQTAILSLQNGVQKDAALRAAFTASQVMGGVCYVSAVIDRPGVIRQTGTVSRLVFGEFGGDASPRAQAFLDACRAGDFAAELSPDIEREIWQKYVMLVGLSATTASMRSSIGPIREHPQTRAFLLDVMREVVAVGRASGVGLAEDCAERTLERMDTLPAAMTASMAYDLQQGNRLELRWLSGGVAELAASCSMPAPLNRAVADILALYADGAPTS